MMVKAYHVYKCDICNKLFYRPDDRQQIDNIFFEKYPADINAPEVRYHNSVGGGLHVMHLAGTLTAADLEDANKSREILNQVNSIAKGYDLPIKTLPNGWVEWPSSI